MTGINYQKTILNFNITQIHFLEKKNVLNLWKHQCIIFTYERATAAGYTSLILKFSISLNNLKFSTYIFIIFGNIMILSLILLLLLLIIDIINIIA